MNQRTAKSAIAVRSFIFVSAISRALAGLWNWATGTSFWGFAEIALGSLLIVIFIGGFGWLVVNVGTRMFCRDESEFQNYVNSGGDPYFDTLPSPMNPDSELTRVTGMQEPKYDSFTPPVERKFQCPRCGARVEHRIDVCWACGYGADGRSDDYFTRWGNLGRPADVAPEEWAALQTEASPDSTDEGS